MGSVPMPRDLSEEAVAEWLIDASGAPSYGAEMMRDPVVRALWTPRARAVRALLREKVSLAADVAYDLLAAPWDPAEETAEQYGARHAEKHGAIVSRVLGDHPGGGHDEGRPARGEAPRG